MALFLSIALFVLAAPGGPALQLPNPGIFGTPTTQPVKLLVDNQPGDIEPFVVWSDIRCGRYFAMSAFYRKPVTLADARAAVNRIYGAFETAHSSAPVLLWRVEPEKFVIQAAQADEDGVIKVSYVHFLSKEEPFKAMYQFSTGKKKSEVDTIFGPDQCITFDDPSQK
jgi:hypothetical protein